MLRAPLPGSRFDGRETRLYDRGAWNGGLGPWILDLGSWILDLERGLLGLVAGSRSIWVEEWGVCWRGLRLSPRAVMDGWRQ